MDIESSWKTTCKVLLGDEVGDMKDFVSYLTRFRPALCFRASSISGKQVVASENFPKDAKFISNDEKEQLPSVNSLPFSINEVKDIDSVLYGLQERFLYAGNLLLGNCAEISSSDKCVDSFYVTDSVHVFYSKNVAYSRMVRHSENIFGSFNEAETVFGIRNFETWRNKRVMETLRVYTSADCFYCVNSDNCNNCLFSFNLRNKQNCIGNLPLERSKFQALKEKLIAELRDNLKQKKTAPSIIDLVGGIHEGN